MDTASFFIDRKAMFGSYPSQSTVDMLENNGVRFFVNLTHENENKIIPYSTKYNYISFPIPDGGVPLNREEFVVFIYRLCNIVRNLEGDDSIYIHCKGGHGRSGVVVACMATKIFGLSPSEALTYTTNCHHNRETMRDKWRQIGSPQTTPQKKFVLTMCGGIVITPTNMLHPDYEMKITLSPTESFKSATDAIKGEFTDLENRTWIVTNYKTHQHKNVKQILIGTGLRTLMFQLPELKQTAKMLSTIRFDLYMKMF
jgi:hypothetical protein